MEININNLIGKVEIHCHSGELKEFLGLENAISEILGNAVADISQVPSEEKEIPCKDKDLCEKVKFNQQVEDIISSNREKSFQQCEALFSEKEVETLTSCYNKVAELLDWKSLDSSKVLIYLLNK